MAAAPSHDSVHAVRLALTLAAVIAGCSQPRDKTAEQFCLDTRITFEQTPDIALSEARRVLNARPICSPLNEASQSLAITMVAFRSAALPFRDRPEVGRTLAALDKLPLAEVFALHCEDDQVTTAQIGALLERIDQVRSKLADITAACPSR